MRGGYQKSEGDETDPTCTHHYPILGNSHSNQTIRILGHSDSSGSFVLKNIFVFVFVSFFVVVIVSMLFCGGMITSNS